MVGEQGIREQESPTSTASAGSYEERINRLQDRMGTYKRSDPEDPADIFDEQFGYEAVKVYQGHNDV